MRPPSKPWVLLLLVPLLLLISLTQHSITEQNIVRDSSGQIMRNRDGGTHGNEQGSIKTRYRSLTTLTPSGENRNLLERISHLMPAVLFGMQTAVADLLWVKADGYFHTGRYERIMPLCHLITWLDPKFLDVYVIGGWHMAYNFMDRRYIPAGTEFLEKGIHNNPKEKDLYFELGNMLFDKAQKFGEAAKWLKQGNEMGVFPAGKRHAYAHALESDGRIEEAIQAWDAFIREEEADNNLTMAQVSRHNRDLTIWRREARKLLAKNPLNVTFDYKWSVPKTRVLRIEGTTNMPELTRVNIQVRDKNYDQLIAEHPRITWQVVNTTLYWDNFVVKDGKFATWYKTGNLEVDRLDLSSEPAKYPLKSEEYEVILTINPRVEPIVIQDMSGWNGEGLAGPHVQEIDGVRQIRKVFTITRDELLKMAS